jgi:hypothetical protein
MDLRCWRCPTQGFGLGLVAHCILGDEDPFLCAACPKMYCRDEQCRVVQRSRLDVAVGISSTSGDVVKPRAASRAEPALHRLGRAGLAAKHLRRALRDAEILLGDDRRHSERRAGLPLTLGAMTGIDGCGRPRYLVAD